MPLLRAKCSTLMTLTGVSKWGLSNSTVASRKSVFICFGARCPDGWHGAIDHIWLSPQVRVTSAAVIYDETCASDHQPLVVDCEIQ